MAASSFLLPLCLIVVLGLAFFIWLLVTNTRDRRGAREVVEMEVAACILKENGDLLIRQRRFRSLAGLVVGLSLVVGSLLIVVDQFLNSEVLWLDALDITCFGTTLLVLGAFVTWISGRGLRSLNLTIHAAERTVQFKRGLLGKTQTWAFDEVQGVTKQTGTKGNPLVDFAESVVSSEILGKKMRTAAIGLQHVDGQVIRIGVATQKAASRVPDLLAEVLSKPVVKDTEG